ncbi:hypothetical protein ACQEVZ_60265 [Dactylosporangium sp. CA-152071]|uniref:hypothetical protein n=1 Tax=Dactylosporangium sp. CA-152071 TaxID=3239933 RepID=UPI003D8D189E
MPATLVKAGLLDVVEERKMRGAVERVYALPARGASLDTAAPASVTAAAGRCRRRHADASAR